jgi:hypothetical protein
VQVSTACAPLVAMRLLPGTIDHIVGFAKRVAMATTRVWFKLQGAATATSVLMSTDALVDDLRKEIKEKLANRLREVDAADLILSTTNADSTYDDPEAPVPAAHQKAAQALIVTSASACLALSCAPALTFDAVAAPLSLAPAGEPGVPPRLVCALCGALCGSFVLAWRMGRWSWQLSRMGVPHAVRVARCAVLLVLVALLPCCTVCCRPFADFRRSCASARPGRWSHRPCW